MSSLILSLAALAAAGTALLGLAPLRRRLVTGPLLNQFRRVMPPMSATERAALDAGSTWWDAELFSGRPRWERLMAPPAGRLSEAEQAFLDGPVEELCAVLDDWRITHDLLDLPPEAWSLIRRHRFFGLIIPEEYGGHGFSHRAHSEVVMKLASRSVAGAVTVMVPNSLGPAELLLHYGTEDQRGHYLPRLARGEEIPCFALTGPKAGSDAASMPDRGIVCHGRIDGRPTLGVRLNIEKRYITLAPIATLIGIAFRLEDPDGLLGEDKAPGITLALVPADTPGIHRGARHFPLGIPFQNGPVSGHDVFVPLDWIIGGRDGVGQGWRMLMETLAGGRGISLPALSTGAGKLSARFAGAYAGVRRQFGRAIGTFEGIEEPLARIAGHTYQMDAARRLFLAALDAGERPAVLSAILKYHLTETHRQVIDDAMDILGGRGICLGPSNPIGRAYQGVPIAITVEGANILTRNLIIFGQGALRCHPSLLDEVAAANERDRATAVRRFDAAVTRHAGQLAAGLARTLWLGLTRGRAARIELGDDAPPIPEQDPEIALAYRRLAWLSSAFALNADLVLMTLAGSLKRRERLSARLGDVLSLLFLASAVLRHHGDQAREDPALAEAGRPLLRWALADLNARIDDALRGLWRNLPHRWLALLLRGLTFPAGSPFRRPDDRLDHQVARLLLAPGRARDALTGGIHLGASVGRMDAALAAVAAAAPAEHKVRAAVREGRLDRHASPQDAVRAGVLNGAEAGAIAHAEALRDEVIQVDAFTDLTGARARSETHPERSAA